MAYDIPAEKKALARAIPALERAGFKLRNMIVYVLYNFQDSPDEFLERLRDLMEWGVVAYPMRFEPLDSLKKNQHIGARWTGEQLEMIAQARRVIGYGGAFAPHEGLRKKFLEARNFEEAFSLRPTRRGAFIEEHKGLAHIALAMGARVIPHSNMNKLNHARTL